jgi:type IV secretion system protein VirB10
MTEVVAPTPTASGVPTQPPQPKLDPETLAIRSRPARAIRFRKGAIIGIAALGSISLMGIAWMALKPQVLRQVAQDSELSQPMSKPASDALSALPASYGDAPKLGPPLPGDLGRPILRAQQQAEGVTPPPRVDTAEAEHQQRLADLKAARESGLMAQLQASRAVSALSESDQAAPGSGPSQRRPSRTARARSNSRPGATRTAISTPAA